MSSKDDIPVWAAAQTKEKLENMNPDQLGYLLEESPLIPDQVVETLIILKREYDPEWGVKQVKTVEKEKEVDKSQGFHSIEEMIEKEKKTVKELKRNPFEGMDYNPEDDPRTVEQTERWKEITARWISKSLSTAIRNGRDRMNSAFLGVVEQETGITDIQSHVRFENWVKREAGITYLAGHMGTGKTDFGLLMAEVFYEGYNMKDKDVAMATNIKSAAENQEHIEYIDTQPKLQKWMDETDGYKLFIFDEASSHATGYSGDAQKVTSQMRSMVRLIRKSNGNMVIIGHDGKDLHPTVRELADYTEKQDKKEAAVFKAVEDREGKDKKFDIDKIPQTSYWYDTKEASDWEWATDEGEDGKSLEVIIGETYSTTKLSQEATAEIFEVSQSKVSKCKRKFEKWQQEQPA